MLLTDKQTDKQTNAGKNNTSLVAIANFRNLYSTSFI